MFAAVSAATGFPLNYKAEEVSTNIFSMVS